ncbi:GNAT family N-acetyltransferase [Methanobacterium oryzae]|uniref:GNAT family N-acetyltransferase n=1 Tax=Methanobacterium oryzae TaxID=69540 RepID=UPI003D1D6ECC
MTIKCDKCILRKWKPSDLENLIKNANNLNIANNLRDGFPFPYTHDHGRQWIEIAKNNNCFFAITVNDEAVGGIGLTLGEDIERISAEVGYWLGEEYWGKGITSLALKGIIDYGFNSLKLERIFAVPLENNIGSRRVLEKNGFVLEGILRKSVIKSGKIHNQALYAIIKE